MADAEPTRVGASNLAVLADAALPVESLNDALPHLRRPFTPEAIKFKVQTVWPKGSDPKGCIVVAYIDARLVIERLNAVVGGAWAPGYERTSDERLLLCHLTVCDVTRPDVGESSKKFSKDLVSDALKRAAVQFGVGVSVYALPQIALYLDQEKTHPRIQKRGQADKTTIVLTDHGHVKLREGYAKWLAEHGERLFGPALDHGDVEGDTVDEEQETDDFTPPAPAALEDDLAVALQEEAKRLYAEIRELPGGAAAFPPATFASWLQGSAHSHEALEEFVAYVRGRHDELVPKAAA